MTNAASHSKEAKVRTQDQEAKGRDSDPKAPNRELGGGFDATQVWWFGLATGWRGRSPASKAKTANQQATFGEAMS